MVVSVHFFLCVWYPSKAFDAGRCLVYTGRHLHNALLSQCSASDNPPIMCKNILSHKAECLQGLHKTIDFVKRNLLNTPMASQSVDDPFSK